MYIPASVFLRCPTLFHFTNACIVDMSVCKTLGSSKINTCSGCLLQANDRCQGYHESNPDLARSIADFKDSHPEYFI